MHDAGFVRGGQSLGRAKADFDHLMLSQHTLAAQAARALAGFRKPTRKFLSATAGGAALVEIGMGDDLNICADVDRHDIVAEMSDQSIIRSEE